VPQILLSFLEAVKWAGSETALEIEQFLRKDGAARLRITIGSDGGLGLVRDA